MKQFMDEVRAQMPELVIRQEEPMSKHTTFRVGGPAELYACPGTEELAALLALARKASLPVTVIGNGSNLLVGDGGIAGLVVEIGDRMNAVRADRECVRAQAGALLSVTAQAAAAAGLGGMEFAAGIPGSVGGAVVMNAGAYGGEMKDILRSVQVLTDTGNVLHLDAEELSLGYRHSCVPKNGYIVVEAELFLAPKPGEEIRARMHELREQRAKKQPLEYPSAGSTFKRPQGYYAGKLIMDAGLCGYTVGGAQVSEKHCGFVVNRGGATAADIRQLMRDVQERVREKFGVELEPEVKLLGRFD